MRKRHISRIRFYVFFKIQKETFYVFWSVMSKNVKKRRKRLQFFTFLHFETVNGNFTVKQLHTCRTSLYMQHYIKTVYFWLKWPCYLRTTTKLIEGGHRYVITSMFFLRFLRFSFKIQKVVTFTFLPCFVLFLELWKTGISTPVDCSVWVKKIPPLERTWHFFIFFTNCSEF